MGWVDVGTYVVLEPLAPEYVCEEPGCVLPADVILVDHLGSIAVVHGA